MAATVKKCWKLQEFVAHGQSVNCLALGRRSGRVMVTGGEDKKVNLWAIGKPNCIMSLTGHTTSVESVKFGHSDDLVCAGSASGALKVWDLEAAKIVRTLTGHKGSAKCLDFHPYGDFLASGSLDSSIKLWDIRRKGCVYTYKGHGQAVNSVIFSPDGRWIASGGEDGTVKLWDLPAGKLLTEFSGHQSAVTDVQYHPNEFLLASGSVDRTVKFWDLESFQQVCSTDVETIIRSIHFNPEGDCLFAGAQDSLRVLGWEPARTHDSLVMGWGKVADMVTSQHQLIAGAFSLTNVSVYVVDLKRVKPFWVAPSPKGRLQQQIIPSQSSSTVFSPGTHMRRSFSRSHPSKNTLVEMKMLEEQDSSTPEVDPGDDQDSFADIQQTDEYNEIFHPKSQLSRTPPKEDPFPAPYEDVAPLKHPEPQVRVVRPSERQNTISDVHMPPLQGTQVVMNSTFTKSNSIDISSRTVTVSPTLSQLVLTNAVRPLEKSKPVPLVRQSTIENSAISIVRPVISEVQPQPQQQLHVFPEQQQNRLNANYVDFVPQQRDRPAELDLDEFLPKHLQDTLRCGGGAPIQMSDAEAICSISQGHQSMMAVMQHRRKNLQIILAQWTTKDSKIAMETAVQMNNQSLIVDILNVITLRPSLWTLDLCQTLLPIINELLQNKYETYMTVGCNSLKLILKNFASMIKTNITAPPGIGVDITREERYNKCMSCYNQLLSIRAFLLKRQTLQGKLGQSFRELHILMQALE